MGGPFIPHAALIALVAYSLGCIVAASSHAEAALRIPVTKLADLTLVSKQAQKTISLPTDSNQFSRLIEQFIDDEVGYKLSSILPVHQLAVWQQCRPDCCAHEFLYTVHQCFSIYMYVLVCWMKIMLQLQA